MTLHTVNKSPYTHLCLASCLRIADPEDLILLIEDGVYAALPGFQHPEFETRIPKIMALAADVDARGIRGMIMDGIHIIDYAGFVELTEKQAKILAWY